MPTTTILKIVGDMPIYEVEVSGRHVGQSSSLQTDETEKQLALQDARQMSSQQLVNFFGGNPIWCIKAMDKDGYQWWICAGGKSRSTHRSDRPLPWFPESYWEILAGSGNCSTW